MGEGKGSNWAFDRWDESGGVAGVAGVEDESGGAPGLATRSSEAVSHLPPLVASILDTSNFASLEFCRNSREG